jgi:hypothetical protein
LPIGGGEKHVAKATLFDIVRPIADLSESKKADHKFAFLHFESRFF